MKHSGEAFWWALFSAGGVMAALFVPVLVVITGFLLPGGGARSAAARTAFAQGVAWWPVKVLLFFVLALSLFHCAHRIRHTLMDLGMRGQARLLRFPCYGGALLGCVWAAVLLWGI